MGTWGSYERSIAVTGGMGLKAESAVLGTEVRCPLCLKRIDCVRAGHVYPYCRYCKKTIEILIRVVLANSQEDSVDGV